MLTTAPWLGHESRKDECMQEDTPIPLAAERAALMTMIIELICASHDAIDPDLELNANLCLVWIAVMLGHAEGPSDDRDRNRGLCSDAALVGRDATQCADRARPDPTHRGQVLHRTGPIGECAASRQIRADPVEGLCGPWPHAVQNGRLIFSDWRIVAAQRRCAADCSLC